MMWTPVGWLSNRVTDTCEDCNLIMASEGAIFKVRLRPGFIC